MLSYVYLPSLLIKPLSCLFPLRHDLIISLSPEVRQARKRQRGGAGSAGGDTRVYNG